MYRAVLDEILEKFQEYARNTRVMLISPNSRYGSALIARLLNHPQYNALYYGLYPEDADLHTFIDNFTQAFLNTSTHFGRHTSTAHLQWRQGGSAFRDAVLDGLLRDLAEINDKPLLLIFDHFDLIDNAAEVRLFIEDLAVQLPPHCLLLIHGRGGFLQSWVTLIAKTHVIIFDDGSTLTEHPTPDAPTSTAELEIHALGPGLVYLNGQHIDKWEGHLPRLLLFFAIDRGIITRKDFHHAFWNNLNSPQATNVFHVTKRRLNRALGMELLQHQSGSYRLPEGVSVYYDVFEWAKALIAARDIKNPNPIPYYERVLSLYRGPFLKGHDEKWIVTRRRDILAGYVEAVLAVAAHTVEQYLKAPTHAPALLERAHHLYQTGLKHAPHHPDLVFAAACFLSQPLVMRRIEAIKLLDAYLAYQPNPDPRISALHAQLRASPSLPNQKAWPCI